MEASEGQGQRASGQTSLTCGGFHTTGRSRRGAPLGALDFYRAPPPLEAWGASPVSSPISTLNPPRLSPRRRALALRPSRRAALRALVPPYRVALFVSGGILVNHLEPTQVLTMLRAAHGMMPWPRPPACRARIFEFWSWRRVIVTFIPYLGGPRGLLLKLPIMATSSVWHHLSPFQ